MDQSDKQVFITCIVTCVTMILTLSMQNLAFKFIFILFFLSELYLCLKNKDKENNKTNNKNNQTISIVQGIMGVVLTVMLLIAVNDTGSLSNYLREIGNFLLDSQDTVTNYNAYIDTENKLERELTKANDISEQLNETIRQITKTSDKRSLFAAENEEEIKNILDLLTERQKSKEEIGSDLKTDIYEIQLFYKVVLSNDLYDYHNIIRAFEQYGIDCEALSINIYTLMLWDIEYLFCNYSMKVGQENDVWNNEYFKNKVLYLNDYKISMNEYSDTFDYGDYRWIYEDITAKKIDSNLDKNIMQLYKKLNMNWSRSVLE